MRRLLIMITTLALVASASAGQARPGQKPAAAETSSRVLAIVGATLVEVNGKSNIPNTRKIAQVIKGSVVFKKR